MTDTQAAGQGTPLATLVLGLTVSVGANPVTPPRGLATGVRGHVSDLTQLRSELDLAARAAFDSSDVAVAALRFRDAAPGAVTAVLQVVTQSDDNLATDRYAGGLTTLSDDAREPLQDYLRKVTGESNATVDVSSSRIESLEAEPPPPAPVVSLTRHEQRVARRVSLFMVVVCVIFIVLVLNHVWIFGVAAGWGQ